MHNDNLLYIENDNNQKLYYKFTPAALLSNFVPLVIILDEEQSHFEYKMWNVLTPIENFKYENNGTRWLGGEDDFYVKNLLQKLIEQYADELECEDHIYLYGNSMGGYGAILHGILCHANAVYADSPHITLQDKHDTVSKEYDLSHFLNLIDDFPIFYLCDDNNNVKNEISYFVDTCQKFDIEVHTYFCPKSEKNETNNLKKVLDMFERM